MRNCVCLLSTFLLWQTQASGVIDACSQPSSNPVLNGIDLVSVFESASKGNATIPVTGSKKFSFVDQEGFEWWFENQQNLDAYSSSPDSFPLGAGGYCALAVSGNDPACDYEVCTGPACIDSADTHAVYDGKLYFFLGSGAKKLFEQDLEENLKNVDAVIDEVEKRNEVECLNTEIFRCN
ncbi:hypothetical protein TrCOL_g1814 [Triparma columacea]|uniref:Uncharacterized protein n=1 Tax=Triparma columacea TaxID=722753 RepID=A0A9W7GQK3_9STRA|nr:hypothetical protein TrCOL_g1814 [Triparma columacea]